MQSSTIQKLQSIAPKILSGEIKQDSSLVIQKAIAVHQILDDGEWHTATDIASQLDIGIEYARKILNACRDPWDLATHRSKGFMLIKSDSAIIV